MKRSATLWLATLLLATFSLAACSSANGSDTPVTDARESRVDGFDVPRVSNIVIDGQADDWSDRGFRIDLLYRVERRDDLQPRGDTPVRLAWDERDLLVWIRVSDDRWVEVTDNPWRYDSVELYVAEAGEREQRYQVVIAPGMSEANAEPIITLYDHRTRKREELAVEVARERDGDTAVIEARLPWANLGWDTPEGRRVAFQVMVNDNDQPGSAYRETSHDVWYPEIGAANDPQRMHVLRLTEEASPPYDTHVRVVRDWPEPARIALFASPAMAGEQVKLLVGGEERARTVLAPVADMRLASATLSLAAADGKRARVEIDSRVISDLPAKPEHPFLITTRDRFDELIARAEREPWKTMAADARRRVEAGFNGNFRNGLQQYIGACALAYILDKDDRRANAERVRDAILLLEKAEFDRKKSWIGTVPPMGAAFVAILALDIAYDDLTEQEIADLGSLIEKQIGKIRPRGAWLAARLGTHGTWELFKNPAAGKTPDFRRRFLQPFYRNYLQQMTPDGVSTVSPGYGFARLGSGSDRPQKTGFADVLEFTGVDNRYYDNPELEAFYRWLFGYSVTPAKEYHLFGDVGPNWGIGNASLFWRVGRFDERAAAYAAWLLEGKNPPGHILSYILMTEPLPEAVVPQSRLFMQGEAVFREPEDSPMSLGAALYNITEDDEYHTHEEANAISLAAYGNNLVVNGGWLGPPTWPASMNNTLTINGESHNKKIGGGLVEGLTSHGFDYAVGDAGPALGNDAFRRSLILVHGTDTLGGYFLTLDEVDADPGESVHHHLHLASTDPAEVVADKRHFRAAINHHADVEGVSMDVFFAGDPSSVEQDLVPSGFLKRTPRAGKHYRLTSVFPTDAEGDARLLAVMFPANESHPAADLSRIVGEGYRGVAVKLRDGVTDFAIESAGDAAIEHEGAALQARLAVFRTRGENTDFYFTRLGTSFRRGEVGFTSDAPISIHMAGSRGAVTSDGATVTLHHPGVTGVRLNGEAVEPAEVKGGQLRVHLPEGRHDIELRTE